MHKIIMKLVSHTMYLSSVAAIIGLNGCLFFMGDAKKEDNVSEEAAKKFKAYLKARNE